MEYDLVFENLQGFFQFQKMHIEDSIRDQFSEVLIAN
jgi:hypothetical protein